MADHHLVFHLREQKHGLVLTTDLEFHLIDLPKFTKLMGEIFAYQDLLKQPRTPRGE